LRTNQQVQSDVSPTPPRNSLFRQEAVDYLITNQYGTIVLTRSLQHQFWIGVFLFLITGIIAFFIFFETTRKAKCQGYLVPTEGVTRIFSSQAGVVTKKLVREGQYVKTGEALFYLSSEHSSTSLKAPQETVSKLLLQRRDSFGAELAQLATQSRQRVAAIGERSTRLRAEIDRIGTQINLQQNRISLAEQAQKRYTELQTRNYISAAQLQEKEGELLDQRQRLADLMRVQSASQRDLANAEADMRDVRFQVERDRAALERNISMTEQDLTENEARREIIIRAPQNGMITAITSEVGQTISTSMALSSLIPADSSLEADIYVPSRSVGFINPGMTVHLRYQAYPYQKFGQYVAHVSEIANTALRVDDPSLVGAGFASPIEPLYRIRLRLDNQAVTAYGKVMPLKSGMLVDASIILEHRYLYEWILDPLFSISGRL